MAAVQPIDYEPIYTRVLIRDVAGSVLTRSAWSTDIRVSLAKDSEIHHSLERGRPRRLELFWREVGQHQR
jgi:hypothetical protein